MSVYGAVCLCVCVCLGVETLAVKSASTFTAVNPLKPNASLRCSFISYKYLIILNCVQQE